MHGVRFAVLYMAMFMLRDEILSFLEAPSWCALTTTENICKNTDIDTGAAEGEAFFLIVEMI